MGDPARSSSESGKESWGHIGTGVSGFRPVTPGSASSRRAWVGGETPGNSHGATGYPGGRRVVGRVARLGGRWVVPHFDIPPGVPGAYARAFQGAQKSNRGTTGERSKWT